MLLSEATRTALLAISVAASAFGAVALVRSRLAGNKLPRATVRTRGLPRIAGALLLPLGVVMGWWALGHDVDVLLVRDGASTYGPLTFERRLGRAPLAAAIAPGSRDPSGDWTRPCWIVNESSRPLRQVRIEWPGDEHFVETDSVAIPRGARALDCHVDFYGARFAPPATARDMAMSRFNFAVWLTWD